MPSSAANRAGSALRNLIDRVAHRSGSVVGLMNEAGVTLPQVLMMGRIERMGSASLVELGEAFAVSAAALSQMIERLVQQGWVTRAEDPADRRRKTIRLSRDARSLLRRLEAARAADYANGLSPIDEIHLVELAAKLEAAIELFDRSTPGSAGFVAAGNGASQNDRQ
jgi:DNA-binding MarR family transcriptional regulator